jgi:hypothetical protein
MRSRFEGLVPSLATIAGAFTLFCGLTVSAGAQQFQMVAGGANEDAAQGGVIQAGDDDNGFIAVGHSSSFGPDQDVYVVRTDKCGQIVWSRTYDFGGDDIGRKIRQTKDGNYVIVGSTQNLRNCCTENDAFLLKITYDGDVVWARTYGGVSKDEGADVRTSGDTYYFAGRTASFGAGRYDGWLGAVNGGDGSILWSRVYGGRNTDGFNALDLGCGESIIAAGDTRSYTINGNVDIFAIKTTLNGAPIWTEHIGGKGEEVGRSITAYDEKTFYIAGYTQSLGNGNDAYIYRGLCETGALVNDIAFTAAGVVGDDQFTEIQTNRNNGNLGLSGFLQDAPGGFGAYDALLQEVDPNLNFVFARVFGKGRDDQSWSVAVVNGFDDPYNYIVAGFNDSFGVFGGRDFYEVRTTAFGKVPCYVEEPKEEKIEPGFKPLAARTQSPLILVHCKADPGVARNEEGKIICSTCFDGIQQQGGGDQLSLRDANVNEQVRVAKVRLTNLDAPAVADTK